ncbi:hypothetical protein GCM10011391_01240 [Pullulanibacillus camelliae]|uniref:Sin domain-containing protein n=1 Tax=Pullulanibacillus camelliae TaxID=1707096 RepID=A0A8J2VCP7_9BACL|nr:anti-repressor SinI family protein [Pullulanibacillus camelliae]GGE26671.1 hypothetical protein GCM10011391_01240 [Pullulanibacillus camelliae]
MDQKREIDKEWLSMILEAKALGLSLEDIRHFIEEYKHIHKQTGS